MIKSGKDTILGAVMLEARTREELAGRGEIERWQAGFLAGYEAHHRVMERRCEHVGQKFQEEMIENGEFWEALDGAGKSLARLGGHNAKLRRAFVWGGLATAIEILRRLQQQFDNGYEEPFDVTKRRHNGE